MCPATRNKIHSVFEYVYRDAGGYSTYGELLLVGQVAPHEITTIERSLEGCEFFIAEQVQIPPLYEQLWRYSNGPTGDDHVWHTYSGIRPARMQEVESLPVHRTVSEIARRFGSVSRWKLSLSPHWAL
jgi:hypothetical protein